jgi:hypothetical protein
VVQNLGINTGAVAPVHCDLNVFHIRPSVRADYYGVLLINLFFLFVLLPIAARH